MSIALDKNNYIVYIHTFPNGKSYVGMTCFGIDFRLRKHIQNAMRGSKTLFSKAIRKYGPSQIKSRVLFENLSARDAIEKEIFCIKEYGTFVPTGYNLTRGGDGGNICGNLPKGKRKSFLRQLRNRLSGITNPNSCGKTDDEIIDAAFKFFLERGKFTKNEWRRYSASIGLPVNYSGCRFNGEKIDGLILRLKNKLAESHISFSDSDFKYNIRNEERSRNISNAIKGRRAYNDGTKQYYIFPDDPRINLLKLQVGKIKKNKSTC